MPSRKIVSVLIICVALVFSTWLFAKKSENSKNTLLGKKSSVSAEPAIKIEGERNDDWKKILTSIDSKDKNFVDLTKKTANVDEDTTLTDQMSKDFLAQYLLSVKKGQDITPELAQTIAKNTLSLPDYKKHYVIYLRSNLRITSKTDKNTVTAYKNAVNTALKNVYFYSIKDDPMVVMINAISTENEAELKKIDPLVALNKTFIKNMLAIEVPESAVEAHLAVLNSSSQVLSNLEAMRLAISDPVAAFSTLGNYAAYLNNFRLTLVNLDLYLKKNSF